jgi:hypothetical protein
MENKMMGCAVLAFGLMFLVLNASGSPWNDLSCNDAIPTLKLCQPFFVGSRPSPTGACCVGAQNLMRQMMATTREARRAVCKCVEKYAKDAGFKPEIVKQLPNLCKFDAPAPYNDPNADCSK